MRLAGRGARGRAAALRPAPCHLLTHPSHPQTTRPPACADLAGCGVFFWKLHAMGLMPLTSSDWISLLPVRTQADYSSSVDALGIA